jgi:hypothetical protein
MISAPRILAGLAAAAITAAVVVATTPSSDASSTAGHKRPDIGARHGHPHKHHVVR